MKKHFATMLLLLAVTVASFAQSSPKPIPKPKPIPLLPPALTGQAEELPGISIAGMVTVRRGARVSLLISGQWVSGVVLNYKHDSDVLILKDGRSVGCVRGMAIDYVRLKTRK